jgi:hypothetical protein
MINAILDVKSYEGINLSKKLKIKENTKKDIMF